MQDLVKGFQGMGFTPEVKTLAFFQDDYGLKGDDDEDDDTDDEDDLEGSEGDEQMTEESEE